MLTVTQLQTLGQAAVPHLFVQAPAAGASARAAALVPSSARREKMEAPAHV